VCTTEEPLPQSDRLAVTRARGLQLLAGARVGNPTFGSGPRRDVRTMKHLGAGPNYQAFPIFEERSSNAVVRLRAMTTFLPGSV
jgi:hypothetical protein